MPMSALVGLSNRDAALSAIGQDPIHFKNIQPNLDNPEIKRWQAQHAAGEPITGFGDTAFIPQANRIKSSVFSAYTRQSASTSTHYCASSSGTNTTTHCC